MHSDPGLQQALPTRHLGQSAPRHEDAALLTGRGRFGDDLGTTPGTLHAAVLRSPIVRAQLSVLRHVRRAGRQAAGWLGGEGSENRRL